MLLSSAAALKEDVALGWTEEDDQPYMHQRTCTLDFQPMAAVLSFSPARSSKREMQKLSLSGKAPDGTGLMEYGQRHAFAVCPVADKVSFLAG